MFTFIASGRDTTRARGYAGLDRKSTRLNSSHLVISYAVFCLKKKNSRERNTALTHVKSRNETAQPQHPIQPIITPNLLRTNRDPVTHRSTLQLKLLM